jgi:hypothetical protein
VKYLAVVVAVLVALLVVATLADARSVPRGWLGVTADGPLTEPGNPFGGEWDRIAASGAETVRTAFDWGEAQPVADGPISFAASDAVVVAAAARHLPVLPVVHRPPVWRRPRGPRRHPTAPPPTRASSPLSCSVTGRTAACGRSGRTCRGCRSASGRSGTSRT